MEKSLPMHTSIWTSDYLPGADARDAYLVSTILTRDVLSEEVEVRTITVHLCPDGQTVPVDAVAPMESERFGHAVSYSHAWGWGEPFPGWSKGEEKGIEQHETVVQRLIDALQNGHVVAPAPALEPAG